MQKVVMTFALGKRALLWIGLEGPQKSARNGLSCRLLIVFDICKADLRPALLLVAQVEGARRHEHRRAIEIGRDRGRVGVEELAHLRLVGRGDPAADLKSARLESDR